MGAEITIVSVSWRSAADLGPLLDNLYARAAEPARLRTLILDNTGGADPDLAAVVGRVPRAELRLLDCPGLRGSRAHAWALGQGKRCLGTELTLVVDPDVHVFRAGWDAVCEQDLQSGDAVAIGAPYPVWKVGKYHDFPSPPFCLFRTQPVLRLGVDWTPFAATRAGRAGHFLVRQLGRGGGLLSRSRIERSRRARALARGFERAFGVFAPDTGWLLASAARRQGLRSILFDAVYPDAVPSGPLRELAAQWELFEHRGEPFLVHRYSSGAGPWKTAHGSDGAYFRDCVAAYEATRA